MDSTNAALQTGAGVPGPRAERNSAALQLQMHYLRTEAALYRALVRLQRPKMPTAALKLRQECKLLAEALEGTQEDHRRTAVERFAAAVGAAGPVQEDPLWEGCYYVVPITGDWAVWVDRPDLGAEAEVAETSARWAEELAQASRAAGYGLDIEALKAAAARGLKRY